MFDGYKIGTGVGLDKVIRAGISNAREINKTKKIRFRPIAIHEFCKIKATPHSKCYITSATEG